MQSLSTPKAPRCRCSDRTCSAHEGRSACDLTANAITAGKPAAFHGLCRGCRNALARRANEQFNLFPNLSTRRGRR